MENFEEKFLEELAKARARLEGKEAYDDDAIEKEFIPDAEPSKAESAVKKTKTQPVKKDAPKAESEPIKKPAEPEVIKTAPVSKEAKKTQKKKSANGEKLAVIWSIVSVVVSFALSCLSVFVKSDSSAWQVIKPYMPFVGLVLGAAAVINGALLIKNNKKGTIPIIFGLLAIFVSVFIPSLIF